MSEAGLQEDSQQKPGSGMCGLNRGPARDSHTGAVQRAASTLQLPLHLPDPCICRARDNGLQEYADCLVHSPYLCPYAVSFGLGFLCHNPERRSIVGRTLEPAPQWTVPTGGGSIPG